MKKDPYRIFPKPTKEQSDELRLSIENSGLKNSIVVCENSHILDGHERRDHCISLKIDWHEFLDVRTGLSVIQKKALAIELNMFRRPINLSKRLRDELIDIYIIANPHLSDRSIAGLFGVNQGTINRRKNKLMRLHQLPKVTSTIGRDGITRKVGKRGARIMIKNKKEYDSLKDDIRYIAGDLSGLIRRTKLITSAVKRKRSLAQVTTPVKKLPSTHKISCCDFRDLKVKPGSVDLVLTDVEWSIEKEQDWVELGKLAKKWLKKDGVFASYCGTMFLPHFLNAIMQNLHWGWLLTFKFPEARRSWATDIVEQKRHVAVFSKTPNIKFSMKDLLISEGVEKTYHDWQQSLPDAVYLMRKLSKANDTIVDPHLGTGTNACAAAILGNRKFIGCDISPDMIDIARHRLDTEVDNYDSSKEPK